MWSAAQRPGAAGAEGRNPGHGSPGCRDGSVWKRGLDLLVVPSLWYALCAYGLSVIVWLVGLSRVPVSQAYPLLSMGYVINIGLAWWLLGEVPNAQRVAGIGVIVLGVVLVTRS